LVITTSSAALVAVLAAIRHSRCTKVSCFCLCMPISLHTNAGAASCTLACSKCVWRCVGVACSTHFLGVEYIAMWSNKHGNCGSELLLIFHTGATFGARFPSSSAPTKSSQRNQHAVKQARPQHTCTQQHTLSTHTLKQMPGRQWMRDCHSRRSAERGEQGGRRGE
jgi:hypothetical protein